MSKNVKAVLYILTPKPQSVLKAFLSVLKWHSRLLVLIFCLRQCQHLRRVDTKWRNGFEEGRFWNLVDNWNLNEMNSRRVCVCVCQCYSINKKGGIM